MHKGCMSLDSVKSCMVKNQSFEHMNGANDVCPEEAGSASQQRSKYGSIFVPCGSTFSGARKASDTASEQTMRLIGVGLKSIADSMKSKVTTMVKLVREVRENDIDTEAEICLHTV